MKARPDFERFLRVVLKHEEPERVPVAEFGIDWGVIELIQGPPSGEGRDATRGLAGQVLARHWL